MNETESNRNLGAIESPADERDWIAEDLLGSTGELPETHYAQLAHLPVYNQRTQPSCGGNAGAKLQNILLDLNSALSSRFVYALCKKIDGYPNSQGTTGRAVMQVLQKYGVCDDSFFPDNVSLPYAEYSDWRLIPQIAYINAMSRRIGPFARVTDLSFRGLKRAIHENTAVFVLKKPWVPASWSTEENETGHFFDLHSYDLSTIHFANSFGRLWMHSGDGRLTEDDVKTIREAWTCIQPPTHIENLEKQVSLLQKVVLLYTQLKQLLGLKK